MTSVVSGNLENGNVVTSRLQHLVQASVNVDVKPFRNRAWQKQSDAERAARLQSHCRTRNGEMQLGSRAQHLLTSARAHQIRAGERARHRRHGDADRLGDVMDTRLLCFTVRVRLAQLCVFCHAHCSILSPLCEVLNCVRRLTLRANCRRFATKYERCGALVKRRCSG